MHREFVILSLASDKAVPGLWCKDSVNSERIKFSKFSDSKEFWQMFNILITSCRAQFSENSSSELLEFILIVVIWVEISSAKVINSDGVFFYNCA